MELKQEKILFERKRAKVERDNFMYEHKMDAKRFEIEEGKLYMKRQKLISEQADKWSTRPERNDFYVLCRVFMRQFCNMNDHTLLNLCASGCNRDRYIICDRCGAKENLQM